MSAARVDGDLAGRGLRLFFLCAGAALLAAGGWRAISTFRLIEAGRVASALVAAADDPTAEHAHPMVQFTTADGQVIRYRQNGYSAEAGHGRVPVIYNPADPARTATVKSFSTLWLPLVMPLGLGAAMLGIAVASFIMKGAEP